MTDRSTEAATAAPGRDVVADATVAAPAAKKKRGFFRELPFLIVVAFLLALIIKAFLVQAFYIPSGSMERTLLVGDRVLVNKLVYRFRDIHRGEVVVFNGLNSFDPEIVVAKPHNPIQRVLRGIGSAVGLGAPGERDFIKRVIGVPGDTVACCTNGHVTVNGQELIEPYVFENDNPPRQFPPTKVEPGKLWVMGDHRSQSSDSRDHGTVPANKVIGRAFVVIWPVSHGKSLKVPPTFEGTGVRALPSMLGLAIALPLTRRRRRRLRTAG
ncbi:MAG: signal peptidase I [Mycobacteriales bacterium]|nr:signal peptidase I [Frankia sp.]